MNKKAILIICVAVLIAIPTCVLVRYDGAYKGRIVDAETKQPVEGVVVLGVWYNVHAGPGGGSHTFYEARETVSDKDGNFKIDGLGLVWRLRDSMGVLIFKSGYEAIGYQLWDTFETAKYGRVAWEGDMAIIPLKKLTMEERRKLGTPSRPSMPHEKMSLMTREINKERIALGYTPFKTSR